MIVLKNYIREIKDFPKAGINFKDITPLLKDIKVFRYAIDEMSAWAADQQITKVVGIESRGFMFAPMIADRLGAGFVPVRKAGKLPAERYSEQYDLEYGSNCVEMHIDAIEKGEKVLIHDDVLATGGTAQAAAKLVERAGGEVVQLSFLIELSFLQGRLKLNHYDIRSLVTY